MNDETPDEEGSAAEPVKVKQVAIAAGIVTAALTAAVAFTVAGPLGVGLAAAGVAGTGYTVHRIRNPRKGTLLQSLLTRPRTTKTKGTLTWPFTGNQQKRALTRSVRASGHSSRSKLPALTSSRARRSAALTGTGAGKRSTPTRRSVNASTKRSPLTPPVRRPGGKPFTPTRTPAKLSSSRVGPLARSKPGTPARKSTSSTNSPSRQRGSGGTSKRFGKPLQLTNSRSRHRPATASTTRRGPLSLGRKNMRAGGKLGRLSSGKGSTPGRSGTNRRSGRGRFNPWLGTRGGQSLGGRSTGSRRTRRAERLGGTLGRTPARRGPLGRLRHRLTPDRNRDRTPNRTRLRPRPYARRSTGSLLRTSLRVPKRQRGTYGSRNGWRPFVRPNRTQAARARRTLRLRSGVWLRRGAVWLAKTPARRWDRLWEKLPTAPLPLTHYTERAGMKVPSGPKTSAGVPTPDPSPKNPTGDVIPINRKALRNMSGPVETITAAFQQLATFHPGSATEVEQVVAGQIEMWQEIGRAYAEWASQLTDGQPFEQAFADQVREIGSAAAAVGSVAQAAHQTMRAAHATDFKRFEEPRPDEGMWDPGVNR